MLTSSLDTVDYAANQWMATVADLNHDTRPDLVTLGMAFRMPLPHA